MHKVLIHNLFSWQALQGLMDSDSWNLRSFSSSHFSCGGQVAQVILFLLFAHFLGKEMIFQIIIYSDTASIISSYWFLFFLTPVLSRWGFLGPLNRLTALKDQSWIYPLLHCHLKWNFKLTFTSFTNDGRFFFPPALQLPALQNDQEKISLGWICCGWQMVKLQGEGRTRKDLRHIFKADCWNPQFPCTVTTVMLQW